MITKKNKDNNCPQCELMNNIALIELNARTQIERLADDYRRTVMIPLCTKYKLTYYCGNGDTVFTTQDGVIIKFDFQAKDEGLEVLHSIFDMLDTKCIGNNDIFGYYVQNITKKDWLKRIRK